MTTGIRNTLIRSAYAHLLKPVFFRHDPEDVHDRMTAAGEFLGRTAITRRAVRAMFSYSHPSLRQNILGINFDNPLGLSAGFDKDAVLTDIMPSVGFGFEEVGSITGKPCDGNPRPRLWRLQNSRGLAVWYGLKNRGCDEVSGRLAKKSFGFPVGTSVAMTNCAENNDIETAIADYRKAFSAFSDIGAYSTVNISCPNTLGGQPFMDPANLGKLLSALDDVPTKKPVFVKLSPDITMERADLLLDTLERHRVHGIIISNLTKKRDSEKISDKDVPAAGGLSGKLVQELSDRLLAHAYAREGGRFVLVGCGGIFTAEDAYKKIKLGASLLQMITGMIFEGPQVISEINRGLADLVRRDGYANISEAVGSGNKHSTSS